MSSNLVPCTGNCGVSHHIAGSDAARLCLSGSGGAASSMSSQVASNAFGDFSSEGSGGSSGSYPGEEMAEDQLIDFNDDLIESMLHEKLSSPVAGPDGNNLSILRDVDGNSYESLSELPFDDVNEIRHMNDGIEELAEDEGIGAAVLESRSENLINNSKFMDMLKSEGYETSAHSVAMGLGERQGSPYIPNRYPETPSAVVGDLMGDMQEDFHEMDLGFDKVDDPDGVGKILSDNGIKGSVAYCGERDWHGTPSRSYLVTLENENGEVDPIAFYQGVGVQGEPTLATVAESIMTDSSYIEDGNLTVRSLADSTGVDLEDPDSRYRMNLAVNTMKSNHEKWNSLIGE